jgi:hypothetical protein
VVLEGNVAEIPLSWRLLRENSVEHTGDTLIATAKRGRETVFSLRVPPLAPGSYVLEVTVDPRGELEEKDERNNTVARLVIRTGAVRFRCEGRKAWRSNASQHRTGNRTRAASARDRTPPAPRSTRSSSTASPRLLLQPSARLSIACRSRSGVRDAELACRHRGRSACTTLRWGSGDHGDRQRGGGPGPAVAAHNG